MPVGQVIADAYPQQVARFSDPAATSATAGERPTRMSAYLAKICMITGTPPDQITPEVYSEVSRLIHDSVITVRGYRPKTLSTPLFGLDAVMFHRGQAPPPDIRRRWTGRPVKEVTWEKFTATAPVLVATMRRYLDQCLLSLRPSSVACFDTTLRQFAALLVAADPPVIRAADISREHIEAYKTSLGFGPAIGAVRCRRPPWGCGSGTCTPSSPGSSSGATTMSQRGSRSTPATVPGSTSRCRSSSMTPRLSRS